MSPGAAEQPMNMSSQQIPMAKGDSGIHWKTPEGWQELPRTEVRIGNFSIAGPNDKKADIAVTHFPGSVGTELDNVNRWRRELGLQPVDDSSVASEPATVDGAAGKLYDLSSDSARTVVADVPRDGESWFFKMRGDKDVVASAKPAFLEFLKSVKFGGEDIVPANPHAGMDLSAAMPQAGGAPSGDTPKWAVPSTWHDREAGPMIMKSYTAGDDAVVTIAAFPGAVGGALANVNRWRGQLGLGTITEDQLPTNTETTDAGGAKATLVDYTGIDGKTGKAARLVAAIVPRGDQTWFYKLMGDGATVAKEKENFLTFVKTADYR